MGTLLRRSLIWDMTIAAALPYTQRAVLDGEIVCLDREGRPQFEDLLFRRGIPCFFAFDLLYDGNDCRRDALADRKLELRRMIGRFSRTSHLQYADHIEETGTELFLHVCKLDLEGIVAKPKHSPYEREPARTSWYKIKNRSCSQMVGRHELFERERHLEPVPGWHSCALTCPELSPQL
jgi:bifunctional non-homologous end joining protein LigD